MFAVCIPELLSVTMIHYSVNFVVRKIDGAIHWIEIFYPVLWWLNPFRTFF